VHKLTENARFFAQKRHFLHIFAGGRDDFLAGGEMGFFGVFGGPKTGGVGRENFSNFLVFNASPIESYVLLLATNIKTFL
jgi:hypothetical protein